MVGGLLFNLPVYAEMFRGDVRRDHVDHTVDHDAHPLHVSRGHNVISLFRPVTAHCWKNQVLVDINAAAKQFQAFATSLFPVAAR